jgi:hypothetical protein
MAANIEEVQTALRQFRLDILTALTTLNVEVGALQQALISAGVFDETKLNRFREDEKKSNAHLI